MLNAGRISSFAKKRAIMLVEISDRTVLCIYSFGIVKAEKETILTYLSKYLELAQDNHHVECILWTKRILFR